LNCAVKVEKKWYYSEKKVKGGFRVNTVNCQEGKGLQKKKKKKGVESERNAWLRKTHHNKVVRPGERGSCESQARSIVGRSKDKAKARG